MQNLVRQNCLQLVLNSFRNPQPVQTDESIRCAVAGPRGGRDQSSRRVQGRQNVGRTGRIGVACVRVSSLDDGDG